MASEFYVLIRKPFSHHDTDNIQLLGLGKQLELTHNKWLWLGSIQIFFVDAEI